MELLVIDDGFACEGGVKANGSMVEGGMEGRYAMGGGVQMLIA